MALVRRLYTWAELNESAAAMAMIDRLTVMTRMAMEQYADSTESELQALFDTMNRDGTDFCNRFCYDDYLGGLAHVQWSYLPGEAFFSILPARRNLPAERPIDRVAMRSNGIMCTLAPARVSAMYRVAVESGADVIAYQGPPGLVPTRGQPRVCACCFARSDIFIDCQCGIVRYCSERCQRAHWREGHQELCSWCLSCMQSFGPIGEET